MINALRTRLILTYSCLHIIEGFSMEKIRKFIDKSATVLLSRFFSVLSKCILKTKLPLAAHSEISEVNTCINITMIILTSCRISRIQTSTQILWLTNKIIIVTPKPCFVVWKWIVQSQRIWPCFRQFWTNIIVWHALQIW